VKGGLWGARVGFGALFAPTPATAAFAGCSDCAELCCAFGGVPTIVGGDVGEVDSGGLDCSGVVSCGVVAGGVFDEDGVVSVGVVSVGVVSVGVVSVGVVSVGVVSVGVVSSPLQWSSFTPPFLP
jgi:hypothetical protein